MNPESKLGITITIATLGLVLFFMVPFSEPKIIESNHSTTKGEVMSVELINPDHIRQSNIHSDEIAFTPKTTMALVYIRGYICSDQPNKTVTLVFPLMPTHESVGFRQITEPMTFQLKTQYDEGFCAPFGFTQPITKLYTTETYYVSIIAHSPQITKLHFYQINIFVQDYGDDMI